MMLSPTLSQTAIDIIGYVAATCTTLSFLPQLLRVLKLKSAREISLGMFCIFTFGSAAWFAYGMLAHSIPVSLANFVTFLLSLAILVLKIRYDARDRRLALAASAVHLTLQQDRAAAVAHKQEPS